MKLMKHLHPSLLDKTVLLLFYGIISFALSIVAYTYLLGFDAYYYALQAKEWFFTGEVLIPDTSVIHRLVGLLQFLGLTATTAFKVWTIISYALFCFTYYLTIRSANRSCVVALTLFAVLSPSLIFICIEFPKTFLFMTVFNCLYYILNQNKHPLWLIPIAVVAMLSHKMGLIFTAIFAVGYMLQNKHILYHKKKYITWGCIAGIMVIVLMLPHIMVQFSRVSLASLTPGLLSILQHPNFPVSIKIECVAYIVLAIVMLVTMKPKITDLVLPIALFSMAWVPALGDEAFNIGARFAILMPYTMLLSYSMLLTKYPVKLRKQWLMMAIVVGLIIIPFRFRWAYPTTYDINYQSYDHLITQITERVTPEMLIVHKNFHLYYKFQTGHDCFSFEPEKHWDKTRIWRLVIDVSRSQFYYYLATDHDWTDLSLYSLGNQVTLIREDVYQQFKQKINPENDPELYDTLNDHNKNPSKQRPAFLLAKYNEKDKGPFSAIYKK
ncbi:hypothetical protein DID76_01495 [Candidatus Marinamargulisbacteria bacterium SCGC AG-414-C22]|nr:hypothetical protein DID76_01495 [Candidatus Marinamargulisbacteria bacterium SCGC AG-414-C22]